LDGPDFGPLGSRVSGVSRCRAGHALCTVEARQRGGPAKRRNTGDNLAMHSARTTGPQAWLTAEEAARAAGVSCQTVYVWIARGRLHPIPSDDGQVRIAGDDLAGCLATRRIAATVGVRVDTLLGWAAAADAGEEHRQPP